MTTLMKAVFIAPSLVPRTGVTYRIRVRLYWHTHYKQATMTVDHKLMLKNNGITFSTWHLANVMWFSCEQDKLNAASFHLCLISYNFILGYHKLHLLKYYIKQFASIWSEQDIKIGHVNTIDQIQQCYA